MSTRILAGRYELLERIGDGGMAVVYKARCRLLNRFVAIKILKPDFIKDAKFIENFKRESQAAASLSHPNIVNIYDVGKEGNIQYIVMELVEGSVLSDIIKEEGPINYKRAIEITKQIAAALSVAHKNQIIHRDVKPHNILITQDGTAKITDFGIAKAINSATIVGNEEMVMGSVHYFSPEQARGGYVDEKSDIYSLGIVLYEMLTGKVPFDGDNPVSIALMHINDEMTLPSKLISGIPPRLEQIVIKATDKIQVNRYKSADEMLDALNNLEFVASIVGDSVTGGTRNEKKEDAGDMGKKEKQAKIKKKFKLNKIKLLAIVLALICAIPASVFISSAISNIGKVKEVTVPSLEGYHFETAEAMLDELGLKLERGDEVLSSEYEEGQIVSQTPVADSLVKEGKVVTVSISKGVKEGTIPKISGKSYDDAVIIIKKYGFSVGYVSKEKNDMPKDIVISQSPEAGEEARPGSSINFVVSEGKAQEEAIMPLVRGMEIDQAKAEIEKAGLKVGETGFEMSTAFAKNTVMWQQHEANTVLAMGATVNLKVSSGDEPTEPKAVALEINYNLSEKTVFYLTVTISDELGTRNVFTAEQRIKDEGSEIVSLSGQGEGTVTVIIDNEVVMKKNVNFNTGELT